MFDISVVIPVYNRCNELRLTLDSLCRQTLAKDRFEVVIADDGSDEDVQAVLKDFSSLKTKYAHQPNEGFRVSAARNLGFGQAEGKIVVYNDNGMLLKSDCLEKHIKYHRANDENYVILPYMYGTNPKSEQDKMCQILDDNIDNPDKAIAIMKNEGNMGDGREWFFGNNGDDVYNWYIPWHPLWGGHFSVNRNFVIKNNIRWNEKFVSWGCEDTEYGVQLCLAGAKINLHRDVEAVHYPTPVVVADPVKDSGSAEYKDVTHFLLAQQPIRGVKAWVEMRGSVHSRENRVKYFKEKGWGEEWESEPLGRVEI